MSDHDTINGFQTEELDKLKQQLANNPDYGKFRLLAKNRWIDGAQSINLVSSLYGMGREVKARSKPFIEKTDTPEMLLGRDAGPTPMEELLVALAASVTTTLAYRTAMAGMPIQEIDCDVEADLDMRTIIGAATEFDAWLEQLTVIVRVRTDAPKDEIAAFCTTSPVWNILSRPVPIALALETIQPYDVL